MAYASGYFKTDYAMELRLIDTRWQKVSAAVFVLALGVFPLVSPQFAIGIANQVFIAIVGAAALMLLTGYAGQISLGHAGLLAAGALTTGILFKELGATFWITLPASAVVGAALGLLFGLPSLRLKGLYLAITTLALHFVVAFIGGEYETRRGFSTGILVNPPAIGGFALQEQQHWYYVLLAVAAAAMLFCINLLRSRTGRALMAIRDHDIVAGSLGIPVRRYKLLIFVVSSTMTSVAGCLLAYYRGFVSIEAFSLYLTIDYVAMVIIGGLGSMLGVVLGALFVITFPYVIEGLLRILPIPAGIANEIFAINYAAFGLVMILFLVFEPLGLVGIWRRVRNYFLLWPYRQTAVGGGGG
jgi:branched-chain amino acid transport system permease protein